MRNVDHSVDVVVVGSGASGMVAAWSAARHGLSCLVIEKAAQFGGNSTLSGGGAWLPGAVVFERCGEKDDPEKVFQYLRTLAPNVDPERQRRFIREIPVFTRAIEASRYFANGSGFQWVRGYPDYYPKWGGNPEGRGLWAAPIDERELGPDMALRRGHGRNTRMPGAPKGMWMTSDDVHYLLQLRWGTWGSVRTLIKLLFRTVVSNLTGSQVVTSGAALITRLRLALSEQNVPLWLETPLKSLIQDESGRVVGVEAERGGKLLRIGARHGVIMAAGGFEGDREKRAEYQPDALHSGSQGSPDNTGDWIAPARRVGAKLDLMDDSWWMPAFVFPAGVGATLLERGYPGQFIVNGAGKRFTNEIAPYIDFGHAMIEGHRTGVSHFPCFMIIDQRTWNRCFFRGLPGRRMPSEWLASGHVKQAQTIAELAAKIGVPPDNLVGTWNRFNQFARKGVDADFQRGESVYDRYFGNPKLKNPNLAPLEQAPFYAFTMALSDLGTKGGMLTNPNAQVLREDGSVVEGLYAVGNNSAAVMGNSYAGPGATLGPAMVFGWVAGNHIADTARQGRPAESVTPLLVAERRRSQGQVQGAR